MNPIQKTIASWEIPKRIKAAQSKGCEKPDFIIFIFADRKAKEIDSPFFRCL